MVVVKKEKLSIESDEVSGTVNCFTDFCKLSVFSYAYLARLVVLVPLSI